MDTIEKKSLEKKSLEALTRPGSLIGRSVPRPNAPRAVAGRGKYTDRKSVV